MEAANLNIYNLKENRKHGTDEFPVAVYSSSWFIPYQWHEEDEFIYMLKGSAEYNIGGKSIKLNEGDCAFCSGRTPHSMILENNQNICFNALLCKRSYLFGNNDICRKYFHDKCIKSFYSQNIKEKNEVIVLIKEICTLTALHNYGYELEVKQLLTKLYSLIVKYNLFEPKEHSENILEKNLLSALEYIHSHFYEKLYINKLAALTGYSIPYFEKFFREYTGKTPSEYIMMYRLSMSQKYLQETDLNILEISEQCGFSNSSYFIREFKKCYNITPNKYRKGLLG